MKMRRYHNSLILGAVLSCLALGSVGCAVEATEDDIQAVDQNLFPETDDLWRQARHNSTTRIDTCWNQTSSQFSNTATERGWVKSAIENSWESAAAIDFQGWDPCSGGEELTINVVDSTGAPNANLGRSGGNAVTNLNFTFNNWDGVGNPGDDSDGSCADTESKRQDCIETIAVHEFGHILGFAHEQNRDDFTTCANGTTPFDDGIDGDTLLYSPDPSSIMSYCPEGTWQGSWLTANDIDMVQRLYGGGSAVTHNQNYALRNHNSNYFRIVNADIDLQSAITNASGSRNLVRIRREAGSGSVGYGDEISIYALTADRYLCVDSSGSVYTRSSLHAGNCYWEVLHTSGSNGGTTVNINDAFSFRNNGVTFSMDGENDWRLLGPIDEN